MFANVPFRVSSGWGGRFGGGLGWMLGGGRLALSIQTPRGAAGLRPHPYTDHTMQPKVAFVMLRSTCERKIPLGAVGGGGWAQSGGYPLQNNINPLPAK